MKNIIIISAPSGAGKTTLVTELAKRDPRVVRPVTHTTRAPRPGEVDGIDYFFCERDQFEDMIASSQLVEHAEVHGNLYGASKRGIEAVRPDQVALLILDCEGARSARAIYPDCTTVFLSVPMEILRERIGQRGHGAGDDVMRRLADAEQQNQCAPEYDYIIENVDLDEACAALQVVIDRVGIMGARQAAARPASVPDTAECSRVNKEAG